jgi:hypothetical protein
LIIFEELAVIYFQANGYYQRYFSFEEGSGTQRVTKNLVREGWS